MQFCEWFLVKMKVPVADRRKKKKVGHIHTDLNV
jgi:hypothetical protein